MPIALQARLLAEYDPCVMFKPEATPIGPRLTALREATGGQAKICEGTGGIALVDSFRRSAVGTLPGADMIAAFVALRRALSPGGLTWLRKKNAAPPSCISAARRTRWCPGGSALVRTGVADCHVAHLPNIERIKSTLLGLIVHPHRIVPGNAIRRDLTRRGFGNVYRAV